MKMEILLEPSSNKLMVSDNKPEAPEEASPITSYVADFDPLEEDLKEDLADKGDDDEEEEEEDHLALADSTTLPIIDPVPLAEDTEAFEIDEFALTPPSHRLRRIGISVRPSPPMAASMKARITEYAAAPNPPSPTPYPFTPLSSPLP
nr:hypothetical protein [Tanacetum cinerariifolium]